MLDIISIKDIEKKEAQSSRDQLQQERANIINTVNNYNLDASALQDVTISVLNCWDKFIKFLQENYNIFPVGDQLFYYEPDLLEDIEKCLWDYFIEKLKRGTTAADLIKEAIEIEKLESDQLMLNYVLVIESYDKFFNGSYNYSTDLEDLILYGCEQFEIIYDACDMETLGQEGIYEMITYCDYLELAEIIGDCLGIKVSEENAEEIYYSLDYSQEKRLHEYVADYITYENKNHFLNKYGFVAY